MKAVSDESTAKDWLDYKWSAVKSDRDGSIASLKKQRSAEEQRKLSRCVRRKPALWNCRKRKLPDYREKIRTSEEIICTTQPEDRR